MISRCNTPLLVTLAVAVCVCVTIAVLLGGCAVSQLTVHTIGISPDDSAAVQEAVNEWSELGHPVPAFERGGQGVVLRVPVACGDETAAGCYYRIGGVDVIEIADRSSLRSAYRDWHEHVRRLALHELGHALGLSDTSTPRTAMCYSTECGAAHVTRTDLAAAGKVSK
jgi:hypothetical protein